MTKRGPIGKVELFYIENKVNEKSIEEIALDLDRSIDSVNKAIKKNKIEIRPKETVVSQQFVRERGSVIMTENASSMIDSKRSARQKNNNNCVTKIK
jgi:hypothetical protein